MNGFLTVLRKECLDNVRDRRSIISSLTLALLGPVFFVGLMAFVLNTTLGKSDAPLELTVMGSENAPGLIDYLERENTIINEASFDDAADAVRDGTESLILVIPESFGEQFASGKPLALPLIYDSSSFGPTRRNYGRARDIIRRYAATIGQLRLSVRGVAPSITQPLRVQEVDVSSPAARALQLLSSLPYLLIVVVFMGGFYLALDTTAGERDNHSLEPLLIQPISRASLVLGKLASTATFGALALIAFLVMLAVSLPLVPFHKVGMSLSFGPLQGAQAFFVCLPLVFMAAALLTLAASYAKSYKEAQTYLGLLLIVPTAPILITQFMDFEPSAWLMLIPSQSQASLVSQILIGESLEPLHVLLSVAATLLIGMLFSLMAIRLYSTERILG
ncbi:MAG: ABC transporter permease [Pseudomonadota bacterium]